MDSLEDMLRELGEVRYQTVDICGLVKKMKSKKRRKFKVSRETKQLTALIQQPPVSDECFKLLSVGGGFSSIAIIKFVADLEPIQELYVSTFRIGKAQFEILDKLHKDNRLGTLNLITSDTQERTDSTATYKDSTYNYFDYVKKTCISNGWNITILNNHSKLILMKTGKNFYVVETSSNLNENPKLEQFNWENDESLYLWYVDLFKELMR